MAWRTSRVAFDDVERLRIALACPEPLAWVLVRRGLADPDEARAFLAAEGELEPPEAIPGMTEAADRLARAVRAGERIVVHGDYDCDGICSTAILVQALRGRGADVRPFLPSRFTDGYGVNIATVERLADEGCDLLVTVDCGTTAVESITLARDLGIETIVCDHHLAAGLRPPAIIANPALGHGHDALPAAAGVTYKLTQALATRLDGAGLAPDPDSGMDLVALATVADAVPLIGENRRLVARGLAAIHADARPGIAALCAASGVSPRSVTARELGWNLAPAVNASGRMDHPMRALEVLLGDDSPATTQRAKALWDLNMERREVEQRVTAEAIEIIEASEPAVREAHALVVAGDGWHEGVVGIVASRLVERFGRPSIVVTVEDDEAKGSGRSVPGVDLHALVGSAAGRLTRWGGHAGAIGLQLARSDVAAFRGELAVAADGIATALARAQVRQVDAVVGAADLSLEVAEAMEAMQPFGTSNPEIRLVMPGAVIEQVGTVGRERQHLQMRLRAGGAVTRAVGWRQGAQHGSFNPGDRGDAIVRLDVERWQDMVGPRVTLDALDRLAAAPAVRVQCTTPCDRTCGDRVRWSEHEILAPPAVAGPPATAGAPAGVRDRRDSGRAVATIAQLAGADRGVVAVVADTARRRALLDEILVPSRLGVEAAILAGERCDRAGVRARMDELADGTLLGLVDHHRLPDLVVPAGVHLVLVDPPADAVAADWIAHHAAGRWVHVVWGDDERRFAQSLVEEAGDLRPYAAAIWRAIADGAEHPWGADLDRLLAGDGSVAWPPGIVADALRALHEIGRIRIDASGIRAVPDAPPARLEEAPTARRAAERVAERSAVVAAADDLGFLRARYSQ